MDFTSITLGKQVRDDLRTYRDRHEHANYNEAVKTLLRETDDEPPAEIPNY